MRARIARRHQRAAAGAPIDFLPADAAIGRTSIGVADARAGKFEGSDIPPDLQRQWIQGTGPATRPRATQAQGLRNVAYALLSGADGWMFDGEDALGQVVDDVAGQPAQPPPGDRPRPAVPAPSPRTVAAEMNAWAQGVFGRPIVDDWRAQLEFTTTIFRARGLHLDDRHVRRADGQGFSASIVDLAIYVVDNHGVPARAGPLGGALPAENPDGRRGRAVERHARRDRAAARPAARHDQGLRARRAGRGLLPADGDPGGARPPLRRLQHRPLGLHQQCGRCEGVGRGLRQPQHRRDHHDLRLHAALRGPRAARRQHAGRATAAMRCGRAAWSRTSPSVQRPA